MFRASVAGIDAAGNVGEWSEWSSIVLSDKAKEVWWKTAQPFTSQGVSPLDVIIVYSTEIANVWEDPHISEEPE